MTAQDIMDKLQVFANLERAEHSKRFFKTGPGEYGEGDLFLGIKTPDQRKVAKECRALSFDQIEKLLQSAYHPHRAVGLMILVLQFQKGDSAQRKQIYRFYLDHVDAVNNWDLVDTSTPHIVGEYLKEHKKERSILYTFAKSDNLWKRRIAIMATFACIRNSEFDDALSISEILVNDSHDLIHKAVGWMLREIGNRDQKVEEDFLKKFATTMPRTMLRYAIEKFDEPKRQKYLHMKDNQSL